MPSTTLRRVDCTQGYLDALPKSSSRTQQDHLSRIRGDRRGRLRARRVLTKSACVHCSPRTGIFSSVLGGKGGRGERGHSCVSYGGPEARYRFPERWHDLQRRLSWRGCRSRLHSGGLERASHGGRNPPCVMVPASSSHWPCIGRIAMRDDVT
jgi:hypothetical protein